uniref:MLO-like protein n=1 Tax=Salix viminalis TaxID=40686 RepID=A0A6N2L7M1_SALVM
MGKRIEVPLPDMAGGSAGRSLEQTPTWAVAVVCFVLVSVSIIIEFTIHLIEKWLTKKRKRALYEALEKMKSELVLLGFISLLLTVGQSPISSICISKKAGATWHPCNKKEEAKLNKSENTDYENRRKLLSISGSAGESFRRMKSWKRWEKETRTAEYQFSHVLFFIDISFSKSSVIIIYVIAHTDPERFRFARETSFGRRHLSFWTKTPVLIWIVCFFRQFVRSVPKVDYLTLRHGFIVPTNMVLCRGFPTLQLSWWIIVLVGTKLQVIITKMGLRIQERGEVVKGVPVVQLGDDLFWFNRPLLNAFQLAFFAWSWGPHTNTLQLCHPPSLCPRNTAKKNIKENNGSVSMTPMSSRPTTPSHHASPVHLLRHYRGGMDSLYTSPRRSNGGVEHWETESPSPSHHAVEGSSSHRRRQKQLELASAAGYVESDHGMETSLNHDQVAATEPPPPPTAHREIDIVRKEFSFDRRTGI